jgi:cation-transporting P-type ATPase I
VLSVPARPAGLAVSAARRVVTATVREGEAAAANIVTTAVSAASDAGTAAAALADIGPRRTRRHVWSRGGRAHIEVRGLPGRGPDHRRMAADVTSALTGLKGVGWAEVNAALAHVLVVFDEDEADVSDLVDAVQSVEEAHGSDAGGFPWGRGPRPGDNAPIAAAAVVLAADCLGMVASLPGQMARTAIPPRAFRAALSLISAQPRSRPALARYLGPVGADLAIAVPNVIVHTLTTNEVSLVTDAVQRLLRLGELREQRAAWGRREEELHATGYGLPAEVHPQVPRPCPIPHGPVEDVADKTSIASLAGAGGILAWTRDPGRAAEAIRATVPKAARQGKEGFSTMLGRELAARGVVILSNPALRHLDRVSTVVIDSAALCSPRPQVLAAESTSGQLDDAAVWQRADGVLRGRPALELDGAGPWVRGRWRVRRPRGAARSPAGGPAALILELADDGGRRCGRVTVGLELDPLADAVLGAARDAAQEVLLTEHDSAADLVPAADSVLPGTVPLAEHVRRLQAGGHVVLTVSAGDDEALDAADVGACVVSGLNGVSWSADLICGPGLGQVWRLLQAVPVARRASERSARLTVGASAVGALLLTAGPRIHPRDGATPVNSAALITLLSGAASARSVARRRDPAPVPRGNWHAMTAEDALAHLREAAPRLPHQRAVADGAAGDGRAAAGAGTVAGTGARIRAYADGGGRAIMSAAASPARTVLEFARVIREEASDPLAPVLGLGAVASAIVGSGTDAVLVGSVMAGNTLISGSQRMRAERALRRLLAGEEVSARRVILAPTGFNGSREANPAASDRLAAHGSPAASHGPFAALEGAPVEVVPVHDLAIGDIIRLRSADVVPADARLLLADDLEVDESTLTGESVPVTKTADPVPGAPLAERTCMLYEGTSVLAGTADAVVTATGDATEAGRAASSAERAAPEVGLQARLGELTRLALPATGIGGLAVTGMGLLRRLPLRQAIASGVAVAVAAVPEGLPLVATVSELAAARRLSAREVLVRRARALEALGRVDTVCFDKTGTLTEGRIAVAGLALPGADVPFDSPLGRRIIQLAARASPQADGETAGRLAHATDRAVVEAAHACAGADPSWRLIDELPFETSRGYSASIGEEQGSTRLAVKGAPEVVLERCTAITIAGAASRRTTTAAGSAVTGLTPARRRRAQALVQDLAAGGLRVLAVAEASHPELAEQYRKAGEQVADVASGLTLAGFVAFADTSRPSAEEALRRLKESGVRAVMITGDHPVTATAIASQLGIPEADRVLTGPEMGRLTEAETTARIGQSTVFARVSPEQKVHIVRSLQRAGHVVAMTGDGTNDAAAIRVADVGIGVSARGSTAARSSADLVLTDPDPVRINDALLEGRALWASARDAVSILLGGNAGEVTFALLGTALTGRAPMNTRQLLLVNLLTDMLPALAVALARAPQTSNGNGTGGAAAAGPVGSFMGNGLLREVAVRGGATALGGLAAWLGGLPVGIRVRADTMGLAAIVLTELGQTLLSNWRSPLVLATSGISIAVLASIVQIPGVSHFFGCTPLDPAAWAIVAASAAAGTLAAAAAPRLLERFAPAGQQAASSSPGQRRQRRPGNRLAAVTGG